ncbi:hypothetical protein [Methylobacterium nonmethylotrophicum]|uniref:Uncharacterized protein n=1 Tax=Methylobacterium nonmethylotrophicum TaxID=1141884 RepID=A0A4Z0NCM4_9HYPH|nr:hypothetical protein [Methylobacterium nonmethylotrophicum]TGD92631.1 hypothetical protein EU555_34415 [Methylobacterium nonmethylotrophicum]
MSMRERTTDHIAYGSVEMLLEHAAECLHSAARKADLAVACADSSDRPGLNYHARQGAAYFEQALGFLQMLNEAVDAAKAERLLA